LVVAGRAGLETAWDRLESQQPQCGFGSLGICCRHCFMGPCRIDPFGGGAQEGICGATAETIVARNLLRNICSGAAAHSDHGREVVEVLRSATAIANPEKLKTLAAEWGVAADPRSLADRMASQFGSQEGPLIPLLRAPEEQRRRWEKMGITPRGIDREIVELLHRTHHGVESDPVALLRAAMRAALIERLESEGLLRDGVINTESVLEACLTLLARSPAAVVLVGLEDLWSETQPQNTPGTLYERANWQRKTKLSFEEFIEFPAVRRILDRVAAARVTSGE